MFSLGSNFQIEMFFVLFCFLPKAKISKILKIISHRNEQNRNIGSSTLSVLQHIPSIVRSDAASLLVSKLIPLMPAALTEFRKQLTYISTLLQTCDIAL